MDDADHVVDGLGVFVVGGADAAVGVVLAEVGAIAAIGGAAVPGAFIDDVGALLTMLDEVEGHAVGRDGGLEGVAEVIEGVGALAAGGVEGGLVGALPLVGDGAGGEAGCARLDPHELPVEVEGIVELLAILQLSGTDSGQRNEEKEEDRKDFFQVRFFFLTRGRGGSLKN